MKGDSVDIGRSMARFVGTHLSETLAGVERDAQGLTGEECRAFLDRTSADRDALAAAAELKRLAGQVDVTIHALGILLCLPCILEAEETVEHLSLGAGNTGRQFDMETNLRIAEFKFIRWRGGSESTRQNSTFKDFYLMEAHPTSKRKILYLIGTTYARNFFEGGRALPSVLSRGSKLQQMFIERFGDRFRTVGEYYRSYGHKVEIVDISAWVPELIGD